MVDLSGVNPANLVPFTKDGKIHEEGLQEHIRDLVSIDRVNGIVCNGHAGEGHSLTTAEKVRGVELIDEVINSSTPLVSGVATKRTDQAVDESNRVLEAGADAILLFPPYAPITGRHEAALNYFQNVSQAIDAPIVLFQLALHSGQNYSPETLTELLEVDNVIGVKNAIWDVDQYQKDLKAIRRADSDVQVLVGSDEHLLPCYALRAEGTILELAAAIPETIIDLFYAVQEGNIDEARLIYTEMQPFLEAVYAEPGIDGPYRLKVALELQGKFPNSIPHEPAVPIPEDERRAIEEGMRESGLL